MDNVAENIMPRVQQPVQQEMLSLRVLARLLDYPTAELQQATGELIDILDGEKRWPVALRQQLVAWCQRIAATDLLELQAEYVALFDKGRATRFYCLSMFMVNRVIEGRPWWI